MKIFWTFAFLLGFSASAHAKAIQVKIVSTPTSLVKGECSQGTRIQMMNESGAVEKINRALNIDLKSSNKDLSFFGDEKCNKKISSVEIPAGENSAVFYFRAKSSGQKSIVVASPGYLGDVRTLTVQ